MSKTAVSIFGIYNHSNMMSKTKQLAIISIFTAILISSQFALSFISGIEIVTVLFLAFAYVFGIKMSLFVANAFSILRCIIFGFFPNILILYLVFYNLFALIIGFIGIKFKHKLNWKIHLTLIFISIILTVSFTILDNLFTPIYYGFTKEATITYATMSLTACIPQIICSTITVSLLFVPLYRIYSNVK